VAPRIHKLETLLRESMFGQAEALGLEEEEAEGAGVARRGYTLDELAARVQVSKRGFNRETFGLGWIGDGLGSCVRQQHRVNPLPCVRFLPLALPCHDQPNTRDLTYVARPRVWRCIVRGHPVPSRLHTHSDSLSITHSLDLSLTRRRAARS